MTFKLYYFKIPPDPQPTHQQQNMNVTTTVATSCAAMMSAPGVQVSNAPISSTGHYQSMGQPPPMMNSADGLMQLQGGINCAQSIQQQHQQRMHLGMNAGTGAQPYSTDYSTHGAYMPQSQQQPQPYLCSFYFFLLQLLLFCSH